MDKDKLTYNEALTIFNYQNYKDPSMRGRTSLSPLKKLGFVDIVNGNVNMTQNGLFFLESNPTLTEAMLEWKFTYMNANIRPFIVLLIFLKKIKTRYDIEYITYDEFGYFIMTINNINQIDINIQSLIYSRSGIKIHTLHHFKNSNNFEDYLDNNILYFKKSNLLKFSI